MDSDDAPLECTSLGTAAAVVAAGGGRCERPGAGSAADAVPAAAGAGAAAAGDTRAVPQPPPLPRGPRRGARAARGGGGGGGGGAAVGAPARLCTVCAAASAAYRCPRCRARYCTIACYKAHTAAPCADARAADAGARAAEAEALRSRKRKRHAVSGLAAAEAARGEAADAACAVATPEHFARVRAAGSIVAALRDPQLQRALAEIDGAEDPVAMLARMRRVPRFAAFVDELLVAAGLAERADAGVVFTG